MSPFLNRLKMLGLVLTALGLCACFAGNVRVSSADLDPAKRIKDIKAGRTSFSEVLEWLGPPDLIIDGTQEIYDASTTSAPTDPLPTRTYSAPEGQVILMYSGFDMSVGFSGSIVGSSASLKRSEDMILIYVSKKERTVTEVAVTRPSPEKARP